MTRAMGQPAVTQVRVAPTRLPLDVRNKLGRWAQHGELAFHRHAVDLLHDAPRAARAEALRELCAGLSIALVDLSGAELRASNAEARYRRAERELSTKRHELGVANARILELEQTLAQRAAEEFDEPTRTRDAESPGRCPLCRSEVRR